MVTKISNHVYTALLALLLSGCGSTPQVSAPSAAISYDQLQSALTAVTAIDYLPFSQSEDGCYARSLYMAMEIAARGIPVSHQFLIATTGSLNPAPGYNWDYHVAPVVWLPGDREPLIIDPSLFDYVAKRSDWVLKLNPTGNVQVKFGAGSDTVLRSPHLKPGPLKRTEMISTLAEVGTFRAADIMFSCEMMQKYIGNETHLPLPVRADKITRLHARTKYLVGNLHAAGLGPDPDAISANPASCR